MADKVVGVDVRALVVAWPADAPRGAVRRFCGEHGVSRSWFYAVRAYARETDALTAMRPRPRRDSGVRSPQAMPPEIEEIAVRIRKELADEGWDHGPVTVRHKLLELGLYAPATSTLARLFTRRGMVVAQPQKRPRSSYRSFVFSQVHECWQLDSFEWALADGSPCAIYQVLDDRSRLVTASHVAVNENAADAIVVTDKAIAAFQVPQLFLTDNGGAFNQSRRGWSSQLEVHLKALGCRPITGRPRHPQTQGKDERVHATLQRWLRAHPPAETIPALQALVDEFDIGYNTTRPHQSLQMRTPAQALADGPLAQPPEPPEPPEPRAIPAADDPVRSLRRRVAANGKVRVKNAAIQVGREHRNTTITAVLTGPTVSLFDLNGAHIRTLTLQPGVTYYSNGRPRGRRRKTEVSILT